MLRSALVWLTWIWAAVFVPIETYIDATSAPSLSEWAVNVLGVGFTLWGVASMRKSRPFAEGLLATGWGWTTAVFWRGTNLRYGLAAHGDPLYFGRAELWFGPVFTLIAAAALAIALVLLLNKGDENVRRDVFAKF